MDDRYIDELFHIDEKKYGVNYKTNLFEQYKIFLQMVDNLIQRRTIANSFFLTVNTGLLAAFGLISHLQINSLDGLWVLGGSIAGIVFSYSWFRTVKSYKQLSVIKWALILEIEKKMPMKLHEIEWKLLGEGKDKNKYKQLTDVEQIVPFVFLGIYILIIFITSYSIFF